MTQTLTPTNAQEVLKRYGGKQVTQVEQLDSGVLIAIYGPAGTGKTTAAATITSSPLASPALHLNAHGNPHVISSNKNVHSIKIDRFDDVINIVKDIEQDRNCPYKSLIYDVVTEMHAMNLHNRYGSMRAVDWQKHNAVTADIMDMIREAMKLAAGPKKMNVVFTFHEVPEMRTIQGKEVNRQEIAVSKSLQIQAPGLIQFIGELYIEDESAPFNRMLDFTPTEKVHQTKFQIDPKHPTAGTMPFKQYKPDLGDIVEVMRGNKPWPAAKHQKSGMTVVSA